jgi:hypothetical protein
MLCCCQQHRYSTPEYKKDQPSWEEADKLQLSQKFPNLTNTARTGAVLPIFHHPNSLKPFKCYQRNHDKLKLQMTAS